MHFTMFLHDKPVCKQVVIFLGMAACIASFAMACTQDPGTITERSLKYYDNYPADSVIFKPDQTCRTCRIPKPARSKHCKVCGVCVSRMDHHCIWLNACVGEDNYRYFLLFLLVHAAVLTYGAAVVSACLYSIYADEKLWAATFHNTDTGVSVFAVYSMELCMSGYGYINQHVRI